MSRVGEGRLPGVDRMVPNQMLAGGVAGGVLNWCHASTRPTSALILGAVSSYASGAVAYYFVGCVHWRPLLRLDLASCFHDWGC